jgi:hypothetical protein
MSRRRALAPSTITPGDLHAIIQILFGWDGDHLHQFEVGGKRYSHRFFDLGGDEKDESGVRLREAFAGATEKVRYEYDFGASWWHEITLDGPRNGTPAPRTRCAPGSPVTPPSNTGPRTIRKSRNRSTLSKRTASSPDSAIPTTKAVDDAFTGAWGLPPTGDHRPQNVQPCGPMRSCHRVSLVAEGIFQHQTYPRGDLLVGNDLGAQGRMTPQSQMPKISA